MRSQPMTLSAVAALAAAASASSGVSSHGRLDGVAGWDSGSGNCPCSDAKLCEPITKPRSQEDVYAFHTTGNTSWQHYDWSQITTVCVFGTVDPLLLCKAHSVGARVTLGAGGPPTGSWNDTSAVSKWVKEGVARVQAANADGLNLDVEISQDDPQQLAGLVPACKQMADAMHAAQPGSHVTFDTPSEGETGSTQAKCGDMYGRDYDYKALADALDFFVVMDYDSNDAHDAIASTIQFLPKEPEGPPPGSDYIYKSREQAAAACSSAGFSRLCSKAELKGSERCAYGWASDWSGYWMAENRTGCGAKGYNPPTGAHTGPAGAYCCGDTNPPCPTCFYANAALPVVKNGVECFKSLGVPASKLVLAYPWYGYDYTCRAGDSDICHVTSAKQASLVEAKKQLATAEPPGRIWQANSSTPHFFYRDENKTLHRVDYDDSESLVAKYKYAKSVAARGTGMWTASSLDYEGDPEMGKSFWTDLKDFQ